MSSKKLPEGWVEQVLRFWFEELTARDWFGSSQQVDEMCRDRFGSLHAALKNNPPDPDKADARTLLAAVIALDQFPRNIFRRTPQAYSTDALALSLARATVASGKDRSLSTTQRNFLYLPFMHSEERAAQAESLRLFTGLGSPDGLKYARHHYDVVARFGRFPHRNAILGRQSTPEELEFLATEAPLV
ncbi:MAG TPA: DUF924 family protein [Steroidobacter sp.]|uniref:DUF924 family protein n=1 Tax=Steroidobacter sp. TaxID=1978227 RepID=UPI002ED929B4